MANHLITGNNGCGKTLQMVNFLTKKAKEENRPIFYKRLEDPKSTTETGIAGLDPSLGWLPFDDDKKWYECPDGAIIVIDECQRLFSPKGQGQKKEEWETALETQRKHGFDTYFITPHPMLISTTLRRQCHLHWHFVRPFGAPFTRVHQWDHVKTEPEKIRADSQTKTWPFPKQLFGKYHSAEVHTIKTKIPARVWFFLSLPVIIGLLIWGVVNWWGGKMEPHHDLQQNPLQAEQSMTFGGSGKHAQNPDRNSLLAYEPRVKGLAHTATRYDDVMRPRSAPKPSACLESITKGCLCFTQQATVLDVPHALCKLIVARGWFDDTLPLEDKSDRQSKPLEKTPAPVRSIDLEGLPAPGEGPAYVTKAEEDARG